MDLDVQSRQLWSCTNDSAPSEARKRGSGGGSPQDVRSSTNRSLDLDVQSRQLWSSASDNGPSGARKRGSGGGYPRKYDDLQQVRRTWISQSSYGAVPVTASRAKRENGGLGEDPPGSPTTHHHWQNRYSFLQGFLAGGSSPIYLSSSVRSNLPPLHLPSRLLITYESINRSTNSRTRSQQH